MSIGGTQLVLHTVIASGHDGYHPSLHKNCNTSTKQTTIHTYLECTLHPISGQVMLSA